MSSLVDIPQALLIVLAMASAGETGTPVDGGAMRTSPAVATQTAVGPYRFAEQPWLAAIESCAGQTDAAAGHARIFRTSGGRYYIPVASERRAILAQRQDGSIAREIARCVAQHNRSALETALHRPPTAGELYAAHVAGPEAAVKLLDLASPRGSARAVDVIPEFGPIATELAASTGKPASIAMLHKRLVETADLMARSLAVDIAATASEPGAGPAQLKGQLADGVMSVGRSLAGAVLPSDAWQPDVVAAR